MRILMLTSRMSIGGAESHIYTLARTLTELGHKIVVASGGGAFERALRDSGIGHVTMPLDRKDAISLSLSYTGISRIIEKFRPDIVHSHSRIPSLLAERYKKEKDPHIRLITTAHMPFRTSPALKILSKWGERTIAVSDDLSEYLTGEYSLPREQISVIENGVMIPTKEEIALKRAITRGSLGIPRDARVFCSVSRSSESRAALSAYLCRHAPKILMDNEYLILCISGAVGHERDITRELYEAQENANKEMGRCAVIIVEGEADIYPYLSASDVFIGVSRAAMEAMAHSLPVIIAGNEGVCGILTEENAEKERRTNLTGRDSRGVICEVPRLINKLREESARRSLGEFCREYAEAHFSSRMMAEKTLEVYEEAKKPSVLLVGYYGAHNMGDDTALEILRERLSEDYTVYYTCKDSRESLPYAIPRTDLGRLSEIIRGSRAVIFGTGNILQDKTSVRSLMYYCSLFKLAKKHNVKTAVFSNGIGPLSHAYSKKAAAELLSSADYLSVRELYSLTEAAKLSGARSIRVGADTVMLCSRKSYEKKDEITCKYADHYLICPRHDQALGDTLVQREFIKKTEAAGLKPILVSLDREHDTPVCRALSSGRIPVLEGLSGGEFLDLVSGARFCISARLHGAVLSMLADTPFVACDTDGRLAAFCFFSRSGVDLVSGQFNYGDLTTALRRAYNRHALLPYAEDVKRLKKKAEGDIAALMRFLKE